MLGRNDLLLGFRIPEATQSEEVEEMTTVSQLNLFSAESFLFSFSCFSSCDLLNPKETRVAIPLG